jgi:hypothetical protein
LGKFDFEEDPFLWKTRLRNRSARGAASMNARRTIAACILAVISVVLPVRLSAVSIPSSVLQSLGERIDHTFVRVDDVRLLPVGADRVDVVVIGQERLRHQSWRAQIFVVKNGHLSLKWDSITTLRSIEFEGSGPHTIRLEVLDHDYRLTIEGCAQHACYDGILGFLVYSGSARRAWTAKLTTIDGDNGETLRYDVQWSPSNDSTEAGLDAKRVLEQKMCQSTGLSDHGKLPFHWDSGNR